MQEKVARVVPGKESGIRVNFVATMDLALTRNGVFEIRRKVNFVDNRELDGASVNYR